MRNIVWARLGLAEKPAFAKQLYHDNLARVSKKLDPESTACVVISSSLFAAYSLLGGDPMATTRSELITRNRGSSLLRYV